MKTAAALLWILPLAGFAAERVLTRSARGHLLHNTGIFSPDGRSIVFDSRDDETQLARSRSIGVVDVTTGEERIVYQTGKTVDTAPGAGAASFSPVSGEIVFLKGLDDVSEQLPYAPQRRSGMLLRLMETGKPRHLDARDVTSPFTPGALRGGTHAHQWAGDGRWISFTYNDAVLSPPGPAPADLRTVGITLLGRPVEVSDPGSAGDFSGEGFSVVIAKVTPAPKPGSDEISRAYDEGWVGSSGYVKADGMRQRRALAFFGDVIAEDGRRHAEIFIADIPENVFTAAPDAPLEGNQGTLPHPPSGIVIRRLTHTGNSPSPGFQGPRHWIRSSPDGGTLAFLDQDADGVVQIFSISPNGGEIRQLSHLTKSVDTPLSWSPDGTCLACSSGGRVVIVPADGKSPIYLTESSSPGQSPLHGVIFSPDGKQVAFNRLLPHADGGSHLQVCLAEVPLSEPDR